MESGVSQREPSVNPQPSVMRAGLVRRTSRQQGLPHHDPFDPAVVSKLFSQRYETSDVDFKEVIETSHGSNFAKIAKHMFGLSNYGGGFLMVGFRQKPTGGFDPVGLPETFHIDQAELQGRFNGFTSHPLAIGYREFDREVSGIPRRFAILYVPPSTGVLVPTSDGKFTDAKGKQHFAFRKGDVLIRRGTSTEKASNQEQAWIRDRARDTSYRISLLSGDPDRVPETLVSNVFPARTVPARIYTCSIDLNGKPVPPHGLASCLVRGSTLHSFEDPARTPLARSVRGGSLRTESLSAWRLDPDRNRRLQELFESAAVRKAASVGMSYDWNRRRLYFPLPQGQEKREESWPGLSKPASRQVAVRRFLSSLKREVGIHSSVRIGFLWVGDRLCLRLEPGFLLTEDGIRPLRGERQGNILISLESWLSSHNGGYLRSVMFWVSKLQAGEAGLHLGPDLAFDTKSLQVRIAVGIREDTFQAPDSITDIGDSLSVEVTHEN